MKVTDPPVVVTQTFNRPIHDVWDAITQLDPMQQWFFNQIPEYKRESCIGGWTYFIKQQLVSFLKP